MRGATLNLPVGATYSGQTTLEALGSGSSIMLASTSLAGPASTFSYLSIEAFSGGKVTMPALTSIGGGYVLLSSSGAGSVLSLPP